MKTFKILRGQGSSGVDDLQDSVQAALNDGFELVGHPFCGSPNAMYQAVTKEESAHVELPAPQMVG